METHDWTTRIETVEEDVKELKAALLGTLDGKPGLRALVDQLVTTSHHTASQLDGLRLDRAKMAGIIVATGAIVGLGLKLLHL